MGNLLGWLKNRATEKSTWVGVATIAATVYTGPYLAAVNAVLPALLGAFGGGAIAVKAKNAPDAGTAKTV